MMLGWWRGRASTGYFVCADRLRLAAQGLVSPVSQALFPRISRLVATDRAAAVKIIRLLLLVMSLGMGVISLLVVIFAPKIVLFIAGPTFVASVVPLRILAPVITLFAINNVIGYQTLIPFSRQKVFGRITTAAAVVNIIFMVILVRLYGEVGAAVGVLLTESFLLVCFVFSVMRSGILEPASS